MTRAGEKTETLPVVEERATVVKRDHTTGIVRLTKQIHEEEGSVDERLRSIEYEIRRVSCDRWVDAPVAVRTEGATTIYPVLREVAVTEKRLKLIEEVHVTRHDTIRDLREPVTLRREEITVEKERR